MIDYDLVEAVSSPMMNPRAGVATVTSLDGSEQPGELQAITLT
jgi:hypothetical protein